MTHKPNSVHVSQELGVVTVTDANPGSGVCHGLLMEIQAVYVSHEAFKYCVTIRARGYSTF